jgi:hypothetical protein
MGMIIIREGVIKIKKVDKNNNNFNIIKVSSLEMGI